MTSVARGPSNMMYTVFNHFKAYFRDNAPNYSGERFSSKGALFLRNQGLKFSICFKCLFFYTVSCVVTFS